MKRCCLFFLLLGGAFILINTVYSVEPLNFIPKRMMAGKASLTENGYQVNYLLGIANFSPELRFPLLLNYNSVSSQSGIVGYAWSIPQLESSALPMLNGVMWTTPWGEKIRFFISKNPSSRDISKSKNEIERNNYFIDEFLDWEAEGNEKKGDWKFTGIRDHKGWILTYRNTQLSEIQSPEGNKIEFSNMGRRPVSITQNGVKMVEFRYDRSLLISLKINGFEQIFHYDDGKVLRLPETFAGKTMSAVRPRLKSFCLGNLRPVEFGYDVQSYLISIKRGELMESFAVEIETEEERKEYFKNEMVRLKEMQMGVRMERQKISGRILSDANFTYSYPIDGRKGIVALTDKNGRKAEFNYNIMEGIFTVSGFNGLKHSLYYYMRHDVAYHGKLYKILNDRNQTIVRYSYDQVSGNVLMIVDLMGNETHFTYDKENHLVQISRQAFGNPIKTPVMRFSCEKSGKPVEIVNTDEMGRAVMTQKIQYGKNGLPVRVSNAQNLNQIEYNEFGFPISTRDTFGLKAVREYNKYNVPTAMTDPFGVKTSYTYTVSGQICRMERRDGEKLLNSLEITYDENGQPMSYKDHKGRIKKLERDEFGRVVKEYFPNETNVKYKYDVLGRLTTVLDQNEHEIKFCWNEFGLSEKATAADQMTDYSYDKFGQLKQVVSTREGQTDRNIRYEYDSFNRVTKITYGDGEVETFSYDNWGRIQESTRGNKKSIYEYDYFGRIVKKTEGVLVNTYTYNNYGQRVKRTTRNGEFQQAEERGYDCYGRLVKIKSGNDLVLYHYDKWNRIERQILNGIPIEFEYTKYGQLKSKVMKGDKIPLLQPEIEDFGESHPVEPSRKTKLDWSEVF